MDPNFICSIFRPLQESSVDDDEESDLPKTGSYKPQVHFVWDMLLDAVLATAVHESKSSFPEFFRIVVDGSFIASHP